MVGAKKCCLPEGMSLKGELMLQDGALYPDSAICTLAL